MSKLTNALETAREMNAYTLASEAEVYSPDSLESAGAQFLERVRDAVVEALEYDGDTLTDDDMPHEVADGAIPVYTADMWATFVDLGAYREDVSDLAGSSGSVDMDSLARIALYLIAERVALQLVNTIREDVDDEDVSECSYCEGRSEYVRDSEGEPGRVFRCQSSSCHMTTLELTDSEDDGEE